MFSKKRIDDAVSPVVAVILMVAVTVILAAVIGSFVLDLGDNVQANPQAGVTFDQSAYEQVSSTDVADGSTDTQAYQVDLTVISMENADEVTVRLADNDNSQYDPDNTAADSTLADYGPVATGDDPATAAGNEITVTQLTAGDEVMVIGELDGKEAVLQTHTVE